MHLNYISSMSAFDTRAEIPKDLSICEKFETFSGRTYSDSRIGQKYGTFTDRLQELSKKASRTETADSEFYGKIITYYDKDGAEIGSSAAPNQEKGTMGYVVDGNTTYFSNSKGKITTLGENGNVYSDKNENGKIDKDEKSSGFLA